LRILVTGGAGFIGTHVARRLLDMGHEITVLDNFLPQIHRGSQDLPADLKDHIKLIRGDVADGSALNCAIERVECIVHLAAETGTGQSMYEVERYNRANVTGTALLIDLLANGKTPTVERLVVASSRAIYGEGAYRCVEHGLVYPGTRVPARMQAGLYELTCPVCGSPVDTVPTPESAPFAPSSFYGLTKQVQEQMILLIGGTLGIPSIALRYQNVFGPGQSLANPYTGILAIFSNLARLNSPIRIFEDGLESRDFIYIDDVVEATCRAVLDDVSGLYTINVGSGQRTSVMEVAREILDFFSGSSELRMTGEFRLGDIRHGCADTTRLEQILRYTPKWSFKSGLQKFLEWAAERDTNSSGYDESLQELRSRGLMGG
jgi:dTDP-L-rhamnose 4-epimerase